jgi:hypothetical protein
MCQNPKHHHHHYCCVSLRSHMWIMPTSQEVLQNSARHFRQNRKLVIVTAYDSRKKQLRQRYWHI